jgi:outer membrane receptor for ferrienterochelin and colicin
MQHSSAFRFSVFLSVLLIGSAVASGQGNQTGALSGNARLSDGSGVPGITVTLASPALQGKRSQSSGPNGDYIFKFLAPGDYTVTFELAGMKKVTRTAKVEVGQTTRADATMEIAAAAEAVIVTGEATAVEKSAVHGANYTAQEIDHLPIARTLASIAALAPGLTTNTPNAGQLSISGAFAYDNKFLVDGVDVNDNLFGTATNGLVIEEAVLETQILTSGISAEYGGFSGGVVNAITKSGGNDYHGSFRTDFTNDRWVKNTPIEDAQGVSKPYKLNETYTGTLGGKFITDRLWFFGSGRYFKTDNQVTLPQTLETFQSPNKDERWEGKLTLNINDSHTLQGTYTQDNNTTTRVAFSGASLQTVETSAIENPSFPTKLYVGNYHGVLTSNLFASLQYSEKKFQFKNDGGSDTNLVTGSPFLTATLSPLQAYNAPYFDQTDPEDRNNKQWAGSVNYYLSTAKLGTHDLKLGGEIYTSVHTGGNSQSPTSFVFYADYKTDTNGKPVFDTNHRLIPVFDPGTSGLSNYLAIRGSEADLKTSAIYINDTWQLSNRLSANIGFRYEKVKGTGSGGVTINDTHAFVPRLGAAYDVKGDGRFRISGTYAKYAGKYNDAQFDQTTNVGNPNGIYYVYTGPPGEGYGFAPAFNIKNYQITGVNFPVANVFFQSNLSSPIVTEETLSFGGTVTSSTFAAVTYINRSTRNFVEDFTTIQDGKTPITFNGQDFGLADNRVLRNSDVPKRFYQAVEFQGRQAFTRHLSAQLNYTYMLKFEGNFEGEASNQPGISSIYGNQPELLALDRQFPRGTLSGYQKHKVRFFTNYDLATPVGNVGLGLLYSFDSGRPYSLAQTGFPYTSIQLSRDPGYANLPATETIFFGDRGSQRFPSQNRFDFALNYEVPIWKQLSPFVKFDVINLFNTHYLNSFNTAIRACTTATQAGCNGAAPKDANGIPTTFAPRGTFGTATAASNYQISKRFDISAGIRF